MAEQLDRLIDDFLASGRARGLSPKTLREYRFPLNEVLVPFCRERGITRVNQLDRAALDRLSIQLLEEGGKSGRPLSRHTIASYLRSINVFLSWAQDEGEAVAARAKAPRTSKRLIDVLSREEIQAMEDAAATERDKLIIRVLADTGIRVGELVNLTQHDLVERDRTHYLRVGGRTGQRMVPIPRLYRRLLRYAERGRPRDVPSDRMFISLRRRPGGDYGPLTPSGVEQVVQDLGTTAGIGKRVYPHLLRHSYATWALTRGMNPIMLAHILGHTSLAMIQNVYSHLTPTDAYEAMVRTLAEDDQVPAAAAGPHLRPVPRLLAPGRPEYPPGSCPTRSGWRRSTRTRHGSCPDGSPRAQPASRISPRAGAPGEPKPARREGDRARARKRAADGRTDVPIPHAGRPPRSPASAVW